MKDDNKVSLLSRLDRYWFVRAPAERPAVLRILVGAYSFYYLARRYRMFMSIARSDPQMFKPVGVAVWLKRPLPIRVFRRLFLSTLALNLAFTLGLGYRVTGPLYAAGLLGVMTYRNSWSMIFHNDNALVLHTLILGFSPAADTLSLDARREPLPWGSSEHWRYGWPLRLLSASTTLTYFLSGVAKLAGPLGVKWVEGETLRRQSAIDGLRKDLLSTGAPGLTRSLYQHDAIFLAAAVGTLIIELGAPLALIDQRLGRGWALACYAMHWAIYAIMGITFRYQQSGLIFASLFEPDQILHVLTAGRGRLRR